MDQRKRKSVPFSMEHGKLPPQDIELEEILLGAVMLEKTALPKIAEFFSPSLFYKEAHAKIAEAILSLSSKLEPIDIGTVVRELKKTEQLDIVGGPYYVTQLTNRVASAANIESWCKSLVEEEIKRKLIYYGAELVKNSYEVSSNSKDLLEQAEKGLTDASKKTFSLRTKTMAELTAKNRERNKLMQQMGGVSGVHSGFLELDKKTGGWQRGDLIVLAARPGMGKTSFALQIARNAARGKKAIGVFSLEMPAEQLIYRLQSQEAEVPLQKLRITGLSDLEQETLEQECRDLTESNILIDDRSSLSVFDLKATGRRWFREHKIELIVIDYLQLIEAGLDNTNNRTSEIDYVSRNLKNLAKELDIPIIALSQLSRAVETRGGDKRPQLSDLRESGAIEQDADLVIFLYRPDYYGITEDKNGNNVAGLVKVIIDKHRNGSLGDVTLKWKGSLTKFYNMDKSENMQPIKPNKDFEPNKDDDSPF